MVNIASSFCVIEINNFNLDQSVSVCVFVVAVVFYKYDSVKQTSVSLLFVLMYLPLYLVPGPRSPRPGPVGGLMSLVWCFTAQNRKQVFIRRRREL